MAGFEPPILDFPANTSQTRPYGDILHWARKPRPYPSTPISVTRQQGQPSYALQAGFANGSAQDRQGIAPTDPDQYRSPAHRAGRVLSLPFGISQ